MTDPARGDERRKDERRSERAADASARPAAGHAGTPATPVQRAAGSPAMRPIAMAPGEVWCHRLEKPLPAAEHLKCLYCFGDARAVGTGDRKSFCDFDPAKDPINIGFPDGGGHVGGES